jgi:RNA polymerase sigma-70 factor, ECF subfamily
MKQTAEPTLLDRLKQGNESAFREVLRAHGDALFSFLCRLSNDRELAKELLQNTWLSLTVNIRKMDSSTPLRPWLFTVARNAYWSHRRWSRLDLSRLAQLALWKNDASQFNTPHNKTEHKQTGAHVQKALTQLSPQFREALLIVGVEGFEPSEAAGILNLKPEAFRQRLSRARDALRQLLGDSHE